jgi:hypothetical protein
MTIMGSIVDDIIRYPLSDWKKYLILGFIFLMSDLVYSARFDESVVITTNIVLIWFFGILSFFIITLGKGYFLRIISLSLNGVNELPQFNNWIDLFISGIKFLLVPIVYLIPAILVILVFAVLSFGTDPSNVINLLSGAVVWALIGGSGILALPTWAGIWFFIAIFYIIIVIPIIAMAIAHMANNGNILSAAFKFHEIIDKITSKGWGNLIIWYVITVVLLFVLLFILSIPITTIILVTTHFITGINSHIIENLLLTFFVLPYLYMYLARSIALFYKSE